jgi:methionyl-tRNA formyltransferase
MRLVFAGTPEPAVPSLRALLASPRHEVVAVVTRPDRPAGRGRAVRPSPIRVAAEEAGLEILAPERPREESFVERLGQLAPDCCPVVAYGALLPPTLLDLPEHGWVNLHFSVLPAWRGAAPVQHAVLAGDDVTGASVFQIERGMDTGPVFGTLTERIDPRDTSGDLLERLSVAGADLLVAVLDAIADGRAHPVAQSADGVSLAPKFTVADAHLDWTAPATRLDRLTRAATPAPGAWTTFRDHRIKIGPVRPVAGLDGPAGELAGRRLEPGALAVLGPHGPVAAGTGTEPVLLGEVRPEGKPAMTADAWARGARPGDLDRFR